MKTARLTILCFILMFASVLFAADEIRKLGVEDLEFGQGTATSTGGVVSTQINASNIPMPTGTDNVDAALDAKANLISPTFVTPTLGVATATTLDTGQGANELYDMNQNVQTTDNVTFNVVTVTELQISSASDNTRGVEIPNTADPEGEYLAIGKLWYNTTADIPKFRNGDNTATYSMPMWVPAPANAASTCKAGWMSYADGIIYVCVAANTWQKATIATW